MKNKLLTKKELEWSPVVANNSMNRERRAYGINSYEKELKLNPISFLTERIQFNDVRWVDLCCGRGNAQIQASNHFNGKEFSNAISLVGMDLVDFFSSYEANNILTLKQMNLNNWIPELKSDLITIVHGLHYI